MTDESFDQKMRCALSPIAADAHLKHRVKERIEEVDMTKKSFRRSLLAGACGCLALASVAFAAVTAVRSFTTGSSRNDEIYTIDQIGEVEEKVGFSFLVPESIREGYAAPEISIVNEAANGEDGEVLYSYKDVSISYSKEGSEWIALSASKREDLDWGVPEDAKVHEYDETREIDGITVGVTHQNFKFVPADYAPTEEDKKAIDQGELMMSYGSDEIEEMSMTNAFFDIGEIAYTIIDPSGCDFETMFTMAEEVIRAK